MKYFFTLILTVFILGSASADEIKLQDILKNIAEQSYSNYETIVIKRGLNFLDEMKKALSLAKGKYIITLDADLSHNPYIIKRLFSKKIALLSLFPLILFPHIWLIQTNVLHESLDSSLFLFGLLFFASFLEKKRAIFLFFTITFLSLAIFDFLGILIWSPIFIALAVLKTKKKLFKNIAWSFLVIITSSVLALLGLYKILSTASA